MIINKKIIINNWLRYFFQINFILFILIFAANTISSLLRSNVTSFEIALNQIFTMPEIWLKTIPISCLLTSIILTNKLIKTSELTALYSIGYSPIQFTKTVFNLSFSACILIFLINGFLQPKLIRLKSNKYNFLEKKFRKLKKQGLVTSKITNGKMWYKSKNSFFNYSTFNNKNNELENIEIFKVQDQVIKTVLISRSLKNNHSDWTSKNAIEIQNVGNIKFLSNDIKLGQFKVDVPVSKKELLNLEQDILGLNIIKFKKYINQLDKDGVNSTRYQVTFWQKISVGISCVIFSFIGLLGLGNSNKRSQSMGASIGLTFVIVLFYWFLDSFFIELGKNSKLNIYLSTFGALLTATTFIGLTRVRQFIKNY